MLAGEPSLLLDELSLHLVVLLLVLLFIGLLRVYNQLLERVEHLHSFFMHFGLHDVLNQDQLIQCNAEIVPRDHYSGLSLDAYRCLGIFDILLKVVHIVVTFCLIKLV